MGGFDFLVGGGGGAGMEGRWVEEGERGRMLGGGRKVEGGKGGERKKYKYRVG